MGERDVADSKNTDSTADRAVEKVRTALLPLSLSRGAEVSSGLSGRDGCARRVSVVEQTWC